MYVLEFPENNKHCHFLMAKNEFGLRSLVTEPKRNALSID